MAAQTQEKTVLGLDLGANSIGWALVRFKGDSPSGLIAMGVRIFEAGVEGSLEQGKEQSRAVDRRDARQRRRQTDRQSRRIANVARSLQRAGLLPAGDVFNPTVRHEILVALDRAIYARYAPEHRDNPALNQLPYFLRARALDHKLELDEIGRAFYHLAQRRGFLSNRKDSGKKDEDKGEVKEQIAELRQKMIDTNSRTLGEYLASVDPVEEKRLRKRWTARKMYQEEFECLFEAQRVHYPTILTENHKAALAAEIFHQRPLKSQKGLIGRCDLEPGKRRAPWPLLPSQRFRLLQRVNDLEFEGPGRPSERLNSAQRNLLIEALDKQEEMTFGKMRTLLKLQGTEFNLERGGEKKLKGNTTASRIRGAIGDHWDALAYDQQQALVGELMGILDEETVERRAREHWGLDPESAKALAGVNLEKGYCRHSKLAIKKLLPHMENGDRYKEAEMKAYADDGHWVKLALDRLPPVDETKITLRNPAVMRVLTELRKVVNAIVRQYGKPGEIHVELARDLKKPRHVRNEIWSKNRKRESYRKPMIEELRALLKRDPTGLDIEKRLLAEECNWECPYTGKTISRPALFGDSPQFDVEHIIPFGRSLDNSFLNKTLCHNEYNRNTKRNRTPFECSIESHLEEILARVERFKGDAARRKLELFGMREIPCLDEFVERQLNDTRYASKEAAKYLGLLYGEEFRRWIQTVSGQITAYLRSAWDLNRILNDGDSKSRDDHRHHAIDALVVALTNRSTIHQMSRAAVQQLEDKGRSRGWWKHVDAPWDGFLENVQGTVDEIVVSHRVNRKVNGRLHEDTNYTAPRQDENGKPYVVVRKVLDSNFKASDIENIVDPRVRDIIREHFEREGSDAKRAFEDPTNYPRLHEDGPPIHRVRIKKKEPVFSVGKPGRERYVATDTNHHVEIIETTDKKGNPKWEGVVVSRFEAVQRAKRKQPVIQTDHGPGKKFVFSLSGGECVELQDDERKVDIYEVIGLSEFSTGTVVLDFRKHSDARLISKISRQGRTRTPQTLLRSQAKKVAIDLVGERHLGAD